MIELHSAVGAGAPNRPDDVRAVQSALNHMPTIGGGPIELLALDGVCGPRTLDAIARFQLRCFGWTDLRIDPGRVTALMLGGRTAPPPPPASPAASAAAVQSGAAAPERVADLVFLAGEVNVNGRTARFGQPLYRGDRVGTFAGARATILYDGGARVFLPENALLIVLGQDDGP